MAINRKFRAARQARQVGMTLLELLLALSLTGLVLMTIGMAIDMHFRMLDMRRTNVEEALEAKVIMNNIAKDLIGSIQYVPPDTSGLELMAGNSAMAAANLVNAAGGAQAVAGAVSGGGVTSSAAKPTGGTGTQTTSQTITGNGSVQTTQTQTGGAGSGAGAQTGGGGGAGTGGGGGAAKSSGGGGTTGGATGVAAATGASSSGTTGTEETGAVAAPASVVGLYGSAYELKFDVSKLPRLDQYDASLSATGDTGATAIPSDVKTVVYFLAGDDTPIDPQAPLGVQDVLPSVTGTGKGLMRQELDRAANSYAEANGSTDTLYYGAKLVSDRVVGLEFQYFDGSAWVTDWDSDTQSGLPKAVEIKLTIQPTYGMTEDEIADLDPTTVPPPKTYRLVVKIPTAHLSSGTTTEETTTEDPAASGTATGAAAGTTTGTTP